jgi:hypothetical protein
MSRTLTIKKKWVCASEKPIREERRFRRRERASTRQARIMPSREYHEEFDRILKEKGIIPQDIDGESVHNRLDRHAEKYGPRHREEDEWHGVEGIRRMIDKYVEGFTLPIEQETATAYVRIAYGHLCLDDVASEMRREFACRYADLDWTGNEGVYSKALKRMRREGYDEARYKGRHMSIIQRYWTGREPRRLR